MAGVNVKELVQDALQTAATKTKDNQDRHPARLHRARSNVFVGALGEGLQRCYADESGVRVLWQGNREHRKEFGMNELLFDVTVCESTTVPSPRRGTPLAAVTGGLWSVESEFARDTRQSVFDFNKLVLSSSKNKLFVAPVVDKSLIDKFRNTLGLVADNCSGNVYLVLVPHPSTWNTPNRLLARSWERRDGNWELLD